MVVFPAFSHVTSRKPLSAAVVRILNRNSICPSPIALGLSRTIDKRRPVNRSSCPAQ